MFLGADAIEIGAYCDSAMNAAKMKIDPDAVRTLIRAAMRQGHAPGKYDVFAWIEDQKFRSLTIAWKSYTTRSIALESIGIDGGEEIATNATPLPNGMARNTASYVGSFRIEETVKPTRPAGSPKASRTRRRSSRDL
jgi:hypothetical protein